MKQFLNFPAILLFSFLIRLLVTGASIGDALVIISLSLLYAGWTYLESKKEPEPNLEIKNRIIELEEQLKVTRDKVNSINLGFNLRK